MVGVNVVSYTATAGIDKLAGGSKSQFHWVQKGRYDVTDGVSSWRRTVLPTPQSRCCLAARVRGQGGVKRFHNRILTRAELINVIVKFSLMSGR